MEGHDHAAHRAYLCSGEPWPPYGGSWTGHVLPGVFLGAWGLHWFVSACYQALTGRRRQHTGAAHYRPPFLPKTLQDMEPVLKVVFPCVAIMLEFSLSGTKSLRCPPGSVKAGELDVSHMNSWSHATNYPPIILSGLVDLIHTHWHPLPHGTPHFFLAAAFGSSAFLMLGHSKAQVLDALVHRLMGYCMAAVAVTVMAQGVVGPDSLGLCAAKSLALMMEGCWFLAITHIMFSGDPTWSSSHPDDATRLMFTPVLFTWIFLGLLTFMLLLYLALAATLGRHNNTTTTSSSSSSSSKTHSRKGWMGLCNGSSSGQGEGEGHAGICGGSTGSTWVHVSKVFRPNAGRHPKHYMKLSQQRQQQHGADDVEASSRDDTSFEGFEGGSSTDTALELV